MLGNVGVHPAALTFDNGELNACPEEDRRTGPKLRKTIREQRRWPRVVGSPPPRTRRQHHRLREELEKLGKRTTSAIPTKSWRVSAYARS
ncbi:MAG: hypothetical protein ACLSHC_15075 [Bilophila wadsworthia]